MPFDLPSHLATMTRFVTSSERDGQPTKTLVASRVYATEPDDLWHAVTDPRRLTRWFLPVSGDLRLGGRYQFHGNAGGTITACEPPKSLAATWEYGGGVSWLTVRLTPEEHGTRLRLEHEAPVMEELWAQFGPGAAGVGWDIGLMSLARHVDDPDAYPVPPEEDPAWTGSDESKDFIRAASAAWGRAAVDDGTPDDDAAAAAERTRAFYSGETAAEAAAAS